MPSMGMQTLRPTGKVSRGRVSKAHRSGSGFGFSTSTFNGNMSPKLLGNYYGVNAKDILTESEKIGVFDSALSKLSDMDKLEALQSILDNADNDDKMKILLKYNVLLEYFGTDFESISSYIEGENTNDNDAASTFVTYVQSLEDSEVKSAIVEYLTDLTYNVAIKNEIINFLYKATE